ncbi:hypothetical protein GCM10010919_19020 [Alishewanella longhuensis]|uniref:Uncharacterized protein n=1 Tax=Alishewanella longhuensis TaxID=1091037 RepID=A0ABQ3L6V8_9ALTE|nr:hypothetical protein [Alishewanella longhuensis]GHG69235.1 hypothetical protein GCM10010919_19020 [Alishewanella longhuensis]
MSITACKADIVALMGQAEILVKTDDFEPAALSELFFQLAPLLDRIVKLANEHSELVDFIQEQLIIMNKIETQVSENKLKTAKSLAELKSYQNATKNYNDNLNSGA